MGTRQEGPEGSQGCMEGLRRSQAGADQPCPRFGALWASPGSVPALCIAFYSIIVVIIS